MDVYFQSLFDKYYIVFFFDIFLFNYINVNFMYLLQVICMKYKFD